MKLSKQAAIIERENERLQNMIDNLTEQLEQQQTYIKSADYFIDLFTEAMEQYTGNNYEMASRATQEKVRAFRRLRPKEESDGKTP